MFAKILAILVLFPFVYLSSWAISDLTNLAKLGTEFSVAHWFGSVLFVPGAFLLVFCAYFLFLRHDWPSNRFGIVGLVVMVPIHIVLSSIVSHGGDGAVYGASLVEAAVVGACIMLWARRVGREESKSD